MKILSNAFPRQIFARLFSYQQPFMTEQTPLWIVSVGVVIRIKKEICQHSINGVKQIA